MDGEPHEVLGLICSLAVFGYAALVLGIVLVLR